MTTSSMKVLAFLILLVPAFLGGCTNTKETPSKKEGEQTQQAAQTATEKSAPLLPADLNKGLLISRSQITVGSGRDTPNLPGSARLEIATRKDGRWQFEVIEDPESNVFHKATVYTPPGGKPGILTAGGSAAALKLWHRDDSNEWKPTTVWTKDFGGMHSRMRDFEIADVYGDGTPCIVVGTHDRGVIAVVKPVENQFHINELFELPNTFVHEIEVGDLNQDGQLEIYATISAPNIIKDAEEEGLA